MSEIVEKGLRAKRESKYVDFKRKFDPANPGEWCELIKDMVAMANSGGALSANVRETARSPKFSVEGRLRIV